MYLVVENGHAITMRQWAFEHNVSYGSLKYRILKMGLTPQQAIEMPLDKPRKMPVKERVVIQPFKIEPNKLNYDACVSLVCEICQLAVNDYVDAHKRSIERLQKNDTTGYNYNKGQMSLIERFLEDFPYSIDLDPKVIMTEIRRLCREHKRVSRDYRRGEV